MPLFVPVIIIGANLVGIATGTVSGVRGGMKIARGRRLVASAMTAHSTQLDETGAYQAGTQDLLDRYGAQRREAGRRALERAVAYLRSNSRFAEVAVIEPLAHIPVTDETIPAIDLGLSEAHAAAATILRAAHAAAASPTAITQLATQFGRASTGTAVKTLSGAAAERASLAWLGGGARAVGGGGMALGSMMGPLTAVGTAVTVAGVGANAVGERRLTVAAITAARVEVRAEELRFTLKHLETIRSRIDELSKLLKRLTTRAEDTLAKLEGTALNRPGVEMQFAQMLDLVGAVGDIIRTPVLGDDGATANQSTAELISKYAGQS